MDSPFRIHGLNELRISDIWSPVDEIIFLPSNANLETALQIIKQNEITSVPVVDPQSGDTNCIGSVNVIDIGAFIVASYPSLDQITSDNLRVIEYGGRRLAVEATLQNVLDFTKNILKIETPFVTATYSTTLFELMSIFSRGVHRVPVVNLELKKITNFISQSDFLRYIAENIFLVSGITQKTIGELGVISSSVHYVRGDAMVVATLRRIAELRLRALPIVDNNGSLIGNFSASDLRRIGPGDFPQLLRPVADFLRYYNPKSLFPLTCKASDTLEQVIFKLSATRIHRLWCINDNNNVVGVVSLTDVMKPLVGVNPMDISTLPVFGGFTSVTK